VVVGVIALLVAILLPSLSRARAQAQGVSCRSNLRQVGLGLVMYCGSNKDYVVPSYNLPALPGATNNYTGGPDQPLDGWGPILDRDRLVPTNLQDTNAAFACPNTVDVEGMKDGQTGTDPDKPRGWTDWPLRFTSVGGDSAPKQAVTIPERGFRKIIRVSYWINAYNPVGNQPADIAAADLHYTASVGLGPDSKGETIKLHRQNATRLSPSLLIVVADGIYMGRQGVTQQYNANSRIGYRHAGVKAPFGAANIILADGHVEVMQGDRFPRAVSGSDGPEVVAAKRHENLSGPTIYTNPRKVFP
jgi:prepilin-type processing-associated H-X9-DG protein